tara:strand:+ start:487 stop:675 length:189 start_codon:yes stop_codon:yes gene_type:complete
MDKVYFEAGGVSQWCAAVDVNDDEMLRGCICQEAGNDAEINKLLADEIGLVKSRRSVFWIGA